MCGIFFQVLRHGNGDSPLDDVQRRLIWSRGPDSLQSRRISVTPDTDIFAVSSVLHLRGREVTAQPLESPNLMLLWNGEVFDYQQDSQNVDFDPVDMDLLRTNDTRFILKQLDELPIEQVLARVHGPWAIVLLDKRHGLVHFARDPFGRRSLLYSNTVQDSQLIISSIATNSTRQWTEADTGTLYTYNLSHKTLTTTPIAGMSLRISNNLTECSCTEIDSFVVQTETHLISAMRRRMLHVPGDSIAIMFSGGIDSLLLAAYAAQIIRDEQPNTQLDLINVAFEHQGLLRTLNMPSVNVAYYEEVPDRRAGRHAIKALRTLFPTVNLRFIACNVSQVACDEHREHVIQLMHPCSTVMDMSIGIALWFGSRGIGLDEMGVLVRSSSRLLLLGMGADEQLGGYSRHRSAFQTGSWTGLIAEMQMDTDRLGHRNLGRDDRCIADHAREARFPFLDEHFVAFLGRLPIRLKYDPALPRGQGEKRIFRLMAKRLGFADDVALRPKKALQFGAKSAKMSDSSSRGGDLLE